MAESKDKQLTAADVQKLIKNSEEWNTANRLELTVRVQEIRETEPKPRLDRDKEPVTDEDGNALFWPARRYATCTFEGGEVEVELKKDWDVVIGDKIKLFGRMGKVFNSTGPVWDRFEFSPYAA